MNDKKLTITDNIRIRMQTAEESKEDYCCSGCFFNNTIGNCLLVDGGCGIGVSYVYEDCTKEVRKKKIKNFLDE